MAEMKQILFFKYKSDPPISLQNFINIQILKVTVLKSKSCLNPHWLLSLLSDYVIELKDSQNIKITWKLLYLWLITPKQSVDTLKTRKSLLLSSNAMRSSVVACKISSQKNQHVYSTSNSLAQG